MMQNNTATIRFLISPLLVASFIFSIFFFAYGTNAFAVDVKWGSYLILLKFAAIFLALAALLHPPVLGKILSQKRMDRLHAVHRLRDMALMCAVMVLLVPPQQFAGHLVYVMSKTAPLADEALAYWDAALGLNWMGYFQFVHDNPMIYKILDLAYTTLSPATLLALVALMLINRIDRAFVLMHALLITGLICVTIGGFFPALGATSYFIDDLSQFTNFDSLPGTYAVTTIEGLRHATGTVLFDPLNMPGLVTFPSFHTAGTIAIAFAFRRTVLEIPMWIYTAIVVASTPVVGGHYIIDVVAGGAIGFGVGVLVETWMHMRRAVYFLAESSPIGRIYSSPVTT